MFRSHTCGELRLADAGKNVTLAGWVQRARKMGGMTFVDLRDRYGITQLVFNTEVNAELCERANHLGREFVIQVKGTVSERSSKNANIPTGEIEIIVSELNILNSAQTPPFTIEDNTDGGDDLRMKYRYLDLRRSAVRKNLELRHRMTMEVRRYLDSKGFLEVETPVLQTIPGGASARPFITHHNTLDIDMYCRIALELPLKRLIVGGFERVYEIGRVFRNEGVDTRHNPEFTLMELYQAFTDYHGMMDLAENLYRFVAQEVLGTTQIPYGEYILDLGKPFERITMLDAVKKYAGVDWNEVETLEQARALAKEHHVEFEERHKKGDILALFFEEFAEEHLIQPTFVMDHPIEISPLTKKKPENPEYTERFEFFMNGWEMANAYSELNDPIDQRERFKAQEELLAQGDDEANTTDEDFLNALEIGMPPTGGIGFGIDRMCMLLTNSAAIRDVLLFPTMKSLPNDK